VAISTQVRFEAPVVHEAPVPRRGIRNTARVVHFDVSGFGRYQHATSALPPAERAKLERAAKIVVDSHRTRMRPIRQINLVGHADRDVQRGPTYEKKISADRAQEVWRELLAAIDRNGAMANLPRLSRSIQVRLRHAGAGALVVKGPTSEAERARNRRVEIYLIGAGAEPLRVRRPLPPSLRARTSALRQTLLARPAALAELETPAFPTPVFPTAPVPSVTPSAAPWRDLISFRPTDLTQRYVNARFGVALLKPKVIHFIEDASGKLNLDLYRVFVATLPNLSSLGRTATPEELLRHIRLNLNAFVDPALANFEPFNHKLDGPIWRSASPNDAVIHIDMRMGSQWANPDDGAVVVARSAADHWIFSTLWTFQDQDHPVSGNRQFGFFPARDPDTGLPGHVFYTRGADRPTGLVDALGSAIVFSSADALWRSLQARIASFVNSNGGRAVVIPPFSRRFDWVTVQSTYFRPTTPRI
jgi:outer membrane protein OmpA-like peptidoglycan-associated protein